MVTCNNYCLYPPDKNNFSGGSYLLTILCLHCACTFKYTGNSTTSSLFHNFLFMILSSILFVLDLALLHYHLQ